jgi:hypothetical protein
VEEKEQEYIFIKIGLQMFPVATAMKGTEHEEF